MGAGITANAITGCLQIVSQQTRDIGVIFHHKNLWLVTRARLSCGFFLSMLVQAQRSVECTHGPQLTERMLTEYEKMHTEVPVAVFRFPSDRWSTIEGKP